MRPTLLARLVPAVTLFATVVPVVPVAAAPAVTNQPAVLLVVGAPGELEYGSNFIRQVQLWTNACVLGRATALCLGLDDAPASEDNAPAAEPLAGKAGSDFDRLKNALVSLNATTDQPLWLVLIGHGTFDGKEARFNLRGPDVTATELGEWLRPLRRPLVFINAASASAPFLNQLSGTNRVILTATRSGNEHNFARFGLHLAEALTGAENDLDQDGQTSLLEAFLAAAARVAEFYKADGRLATEHALLDDNGDRLGTPADWFRGVRPIKKPEGGASVDGTRAHQLHLAPGQAEQDLPAEVRARRNALELALARLRETRAQRDEQEYYRELEKLLLQLVETYGNHL